LAFNREILPRLKKELQVLQKILNKHIVCVYGVVKWAGSMGLVLEYMPGGNLSQFIDDDDDNIRSSMLLFLRIFYELSSALAFIHNLPDSQRVVHGDLKPENALLTSDLHCKLSDFGSAQVVALTGSTTSESIKPKTSGMTLAFAAPEKLKSLNTKPKKEHDTYSFGMILYVILSGSRPYQHPDHENAFAESIKRGERPEEITIDERRVTLSQPRQQILDVLQSIMRKCWTQDPSHRPNMLKVRDGLQSVIDQHRGVDILTEVTEMLRCMSLNVPRKHEQQFLPLHHFLVKEQRFMQGLVFLSAHVVSQYD